MEPASPALRVLRLNIANNAANIVIKFPMISNLKANHRPLTDIAYELTKLSSI